MFENLDAVPWAELDHAYGPATDAPKWIRALDSKDEHLRMDALMHFLFSSVSHQYTLYSATPFVIPFVIEALGSTSVRERSSGFNESMAFYVIQFLRSCADGGQRAMAGRPHPKAPTVEQAIAAGAHVYERLLADPDSQVRTDAAWLLEFCHRHESTPNKAL